MPVNRLPWALQFVLEFVIFLLPLAIFFTAPSYDFPLLLTMGVLACTLTFLPFGGRSEAEDSAGMLDDLKTDEKRIPFITNLRATTMILTVMAILAVDFRNFPGRYFKTVSYGTTLMDVGIGSIIYVSGLVVSERSDPTWAAAFFSSLPLLGLGGVRFAFVRLFMKGGHDSEYGRHWNFFMSLGILCYLTTLVRKIIPLKWMLPAGVLASVAYELVLKLTSWEAYMMDSTVRIHSIIDANKVGLFGLLGNVLIFMVSAGLVYHLRKIYTNKHLILRRLISLSIGSWAIYFGLKHYLHLEASRRLVNLQFVLWISCLSTTHMTMYVLADTLVPTGPGHAYIFEAINQNMLLVFLVCNLVTGLVNLSIKTKAVGTVVAFSVLTAYALFFSLGAVILKRHDITVKFK